MSRLKFHLTRKFKLVLIRNFINIPDIITNPLNNATSMICLVKLWN